MSAFARSLLCLALVVFTLSTARAADPKAAREALLAARYALAGKNVDDVQVMGHGFNIYAAQSREGNGVTIISGRIAHRLRLRKDDQVYYTILKRGDQVLGVKIEIDRGGVTSYVGKVVGFLSHNPVSGEKLGEWLGEAADKLYGGWEESAELIVAAIALKANSRPYVPGNNRPEAGTTRPPAVKLPLTNIPSAVLQKK